MAWKANWMLLVKMVLLFSYWGFSSWQHVNNNLKIEFFPLSLKCIGYLLISDLLQKNDWFKKVSHYFHSRIVLKNQPLKHTSSQFSAWQYFLSIPNPLLSRRLIPDTSSSRPGGWPSAATTAGPWPSCGGSPPWTGSASWPSTSARWRSCCRTARSRRCTAWRPSSAAGGWPRTPSCAWSAGEYEKVVFLRVCGIYSF